MEEYAGETRSDPHDFLFRYFILPITWNLNVMTIE
jgi:hypothetical protein